MQSTLIPLMAKLGDTVRYRQAWSAKVHAVSKFIDKKDICFPLYVGVQIRDFA